MRNTILTTDIGNKEFFVVVQLLGFFWGGGWGWAGRNRKKKKNCKHQIYITNF